LYNFVLILSLLLPLYVVNKDSQYSDWDPSNGGVECRWGIGRIAILSQYLAPSRAVNAWSGRCNTLGCDGPWRVDDTCRW